MSRKFSLILAGVVIVAFVIAAWQLSGKSGAPVTPPDTLLVEVRTKVDSMPARLESLLANTIPVVRTDRVAVSVKRGSLPAEYIFDINIDGEQLAPIAIVHEGQDIQTIAAGDDWSVRLVTDGLLKKLNTTE